MPFSRSVDIDTEEDLKLVKYFIKNNDKLDNKIIYIIGGYGLVGRELINRSKNKI